MANEEKTIITPTDLYGIITKLPPKTKAADPTAQEVAQSVAKELRTKILSKVAEGKISINTPAMYLKPTFLLDSLTPYIKIQIILPKGLANEFEYIDLFDSEENPSHSFLKSMKFDIMPQGGDSTSTGGGNLVITFTSINQEIIEILAMRFAYLHQMSNNPPRILVDFGWSVSPELKRQYKDSCVFTRIVSGPLAIGDVVFNKDGSIEATLSCVVDDNSNSFPPPYNGYLPKEIVGPYPGVTVALYIVLKKFDKMFPKEDGQKNSTIPEKDIRSQLLIFIIIYLTKDRNKIIELYNNIIKNYLGDCTVKNTELLNELNKIAIQSKKTQFTIRSQVSVDNTDIIKDFINDLNELEANQRSKILQNVVNYQNVYPDFIKELLPYISEMYIHPYLVFEYLKRSFENGLKNSEAFKDIEKDVQLHIISLVPEENIYPLKYITRDSESKKINIDQGKFEKLQQAEKEKYGRKAQEVLYLDNGTSWITAFEQLERKMYASIVVSKDIYSKAMKEINKDKTTSVGGSVQEKQYYLHHPLTTKLMYLSSKDEAITKINYFIKYLEVDKKEVNRKEQIDGINKIKNEIETKEKGVFLLVRDITPGTEIFESTGGAGTKRILQAYSILTNGNPNNYKDNFNPGYPTVWDISFPDVLDFSPTFNFLSYIQGLKMNEKITMNASYGNKTIEDIKNELDTEGKALNKNLIDWKKTNSKKTVLDEKKPVDKELKNKLNNFEKKYKTYEEIKSKRFDSYRQAYKDTHPVCLDLDFKQKDSYTGDYSGTIEMKRTLQNFRKMLMFESKNITGTLRVLGDPIFSIHDIGKYIFLKVFMPDGSLSFFTGLYVIGPVTHEISPGKFETTINISTENIATDEVYGLEITEAIYGQDRIQVSIQE